MADATATKTNSPVPPTRLKQICNDACVSTLEKSDGYVHSMTESWNSSVINHILRALISESTPQQVGSAPAQTPYKFAVNSTIIQHAHSKVQATKSEGQESEDPATTGGRRGMHSACGGFWNTEKDGMWSFKYETKNMDVVISVIWIAV